MKKEKDYKYKIIMYLKQLPHADYTYSRKNLHLIMNTSKATFERWISIKLDSKQEIPADKLALIALYLDVAMEELFNYDLPKIRPDNIRKVINVKLSAYEYGLIN